jgi:hypothetical protein
MAKHTRRAGHAAQLPTFLPSLDTLPVPVMLARRVGAVVARPVRWVVAKPERALILAWLVALMVVGNGVAAGADQIIHGPNLAQGGPKSLYETYGFLHYHLTFLPDSDHTGTFHIQKVSWRFLNWLADLGLWIILGVVYGAIAVLEWFLDLTVYRDAHTQIDELVRAWAGTVFWPLIITTATIGLGMAYARWRGENRSFAGEVVWILAACVIGAGFASGPSTIMNRIDQGRQDVGNAVIAGSTHFLHQRPSPTGFQEPNLAAGAGGGHIDQHQATRALAEGLWDSYGATPWCYAEFNSLTICKKAGYHQLANDHQWHQWKEKLKENRQVAAFGSHQDFIRGQTVQRLGVVLVLMIVALPLGFLLAWLLFKGFLAIGGLLFMLVAALLLLVLWPLPGAGRRIGTAAWVYLLGQELQLVFITTGLAVVMGLSAVLSSIAGQEGFFLTALLNLAVIAAAVKASGWLENMTGVSGGGGMGFGTFLMVRSAVRMATRAAAVATTGGAGAAAAGGRWLGKGARPASNWNTAGKKRSPMTNQTTDPSRRGSFQTWRRLRRQNPRPGGPTPGGPAPGGAMPKQVPAAAGGRARRAGRAAATKATGAYQRARRAHREVAFVHGARQREPGEQALRENAARRKNRTRPSSGDRGGR